MDPSELTDFDIGPSRGRRPVPLRIEVVRALTPADMPLLVSPPSANSQAPTIQALRASHHQLAQILATGTSETEASLITGYSISRISILKSDPTFAELLSNYASQRELAFADTLERMRILGLSALDELQERLEQSPDRWSNREVMEMAELMLIKPRIATPMGQQSSLGGSPIGPNGASGASGVTVNVKFVTAEAPTLIIDGQSE